MIRARCWRLRLNISAHEKTRENCRGTTAFSLVECVEMVLILIKVERLKVKRLLSQFEVKPLKLLSKKGI